MQNIHILRHEKDEGQICSNEHVILLIIQDMSEVITDYHRISENTINYHRTLFTY